MLILVTKSMLVNIYNDHIIINDLLSQKVSVLHHVFEMRHY